MADQRPNQKFNKAWVISVDMGYGHARAAYPLKDIAYDRIITANSDKIIQDDEKRLWRKTHKFYDWISRMTGFPVIGKAVFKMYDKLQHISPYYPFRDLSKSNFEVNYIDRLIRKGLCRSVSEFTKKDRRPFITTYFIPALAADYNGKEDVYCVVTDSDISRVWVAKDPKRSKVRYLSPTKHTTKRLMQYGVPRTRIFDTGFPLPKELIGGREKNILKKTVANRLANLDPGRCFIDKYRSHMKKHLEQDIPKRSDHPLTLMCAIGGAGAQSEIVERIISSLKNEILKKKIRLFVVTGTRLEISQKVDKMILDYGLEKEAGIGISQINALNKRAYFERFNEALKTTDMLWSKPSEISFYTALGIPIIISPPVGAHEIYNKQWLLRHNFGIEQDNPDYICEWLFDWLNDGRLANLCWDGYLGAPNLGVYEIERVVLGK